MVALSETVSGIGVRVSGNLGGNGWARLRAVQVVTGEVPPALQPTIYVPIKRGETLTYGEVVARKV